MDNEKELIERAKNGSTLAFREIVEQHKRNIYFLALDICGNSHDAEDITQETFIKAFQGIKYFRGESKLNSWLYRITVNCAIDKKRKKHLPMLLLTDTQNNRHQIEVPDSSGFNNQTVEDRLQHRTIQIHIRNALKKLTIRERTVFVLRHYQDLPLKEIGEMLNIAEGTVKSLLFRSVKRLQKELMIHREELGISK